MEQLASCLRQKLKGLMGLKIEVEDYDIYVYNSYNIITEVAASRIFKFAKKNRLQSYIGVSDSGHIRFVLYKD